MINYLDQLEPIYTQSDIFTDTAEGQSPDSYGGRITGFGHPAMGATGKKNLTMGLKDLTDPSTPSMISLIERCNVELGLYLLMITGP